MTLDYAVMDVACNIRDTVEDDIYYIFDDTLICTKQADVATEYALKSALSTDPSIHTRY